MKIAATSRLAFVLTLLLGVATIASAETIKTTATRTQNDSATTTGVFKALNQAGATSVSFSTTAASAQIKITYNAECGVLGNPGSWVAVTVLVDGVEANPKNGTDFAMCTATSTTLFNWVGAVRQSVTKVGAGTHTVQIKVDLVGATTWWLGDTSLVVEAQ